MESSGSEERDESMLDQEIDSDEDEMELEEGEEGEEEEDSLDDEGLDGEEEEEEGEEEKVEKEELDGVDDVLDEEQDHRIETNIDSKREKMISDLISKEDLGIIQMRVRETIKVLSNFK
jgi:hypothetical protein